MNPRKMKQMMKQMGIDVEELDAERVVVETADGDLVFESPQVTRMDAQGQQTYQIVGDPDEVDDAGAGGASAIEAGDDAADADEGAGSAGGIPDDDVALVAERAGVPESLARESLEAHDGDLAAAIAELE
ncbi:nascent polypeptide-associated complex protein [Halorubrum aquaticum]